MKSEDTSKIRLSDNIRHFPTKYKLLFQKKSLDIKGPVVFFDMISLTAYPYVIDSLFISLGDNYDAAPESLESRKRRQ